MRTAINVIKHYQTTVSRIPKLLEDSEANDTLVTNLAEYKPESPAILTVKEGEPINLTIHDEASAYTYMHLSGWWWRKWLCNSTDEMITGAEKQV